MLLFCVVVTSIWECAPLFIVCGSSPTNDDSLSLGEVEYAFARLKFKGSGLLFGLALFTIIVPQTMISLPMYIQIEHKSLSLQERIRACLIWERDFV